MTEDRYTRTRNLIGNDSLEKLQNASVLLFGLGGVGGFCAEALARAGIGKLCIVDNDIVDITNLNRQIIATLDSLGRAKTDLFEERIRSIDPHISVDKRKLFFLPENSDSFDFSEYDYVVDAIDTVTAKIEIAVKANEQRTKLISCMGTGNRMDPSRLMIADLSETHMCRLAKVMRKELRIRGISHLKVLFSDEKPLIMDPPGSISFVPSVAGLMIAGEVIRDMIGWEAK